MAPQFEMCRCAAQLAPGAMSTPGLNVCKSCYCQICYGTSFFADHCTVSHDAQVAPAGLACLSAHACLEQSQSCWQISKQNVLPSAGTPRLSLYKQCACTTRPFERFPDEFASVLWASLASFHLYARIQATLAVCTLCELL